VNGLVAGDKLEKSSFLYITIALTVAILAIFDYGSRVLDRILDVKFADWLGIVGLFLSVSGIYFAALAMRDIRRVINTFDDFADRLIKLIEEANSDSRKLDRVRIMAYTPLPGALALPREVYKAIRKIVFHSDTRLEVTCLDPSSF
jgi:hypothetical protein